MNPEHSKLSNSPNMDEEDLWQSILKRDHRWDGIFVYAVLSTGIYCRPSCSSRKPRRDNVVFFSLPEVAEQVGFRACKRCQPDQIVTQDPQVELIRKVCRYIEANLESPLTLQVLSNHFHLSTYHLQRTFKRLTGITPQQYTEACRMKQIMVDLSEGREIMSTLYNAGYNSSSRLYNKAFLQLGMTPAVYKKGGQEIQIVYTTVECLFGYLLVAATDKGICAVQIGDTENGLKEAFFKLFKRAAIERDDLALSGWVQEILDHLDGKHPHLELPLDIQATAFQKRVWQALREIPYGSTRTYREIAEAIGQPSAVRAVARACATNPAALLIPCHRVIRSDGNLGGYRWGIERKQVLLHKEAAHASNPRGGHEKDF